MQAWQHGNIFAYFAFYSEVELVQKMIDGVNTLYMEDEALMKAQGI